MPFCPACRSEFRPGFTRCEECDAALVAELPKPPAPPAVPRPAFQSVYRTTELAEAEAVRLLLEGSGIPVQLENQWSGIATFGMPTTSAPFILTVPSAEGARASKIIEEAQKSRKPRVASNRKKWWLAAVLTEPLAVLLAGVMGALKRLGVVSKS
jgi:hypothetical protein